MSKLNNREISVLSHCIGNMPESVHAFAGAGNKTIKGLIEKGYLTYTRQPGYTYGEYVEMTPEGEAALNRCL